MGAIITARDPPPTDFRWDQTVLQLQLLKDQTVLHTRLLKDFVIPSQIKQGVEWLTKFIN